MAITIEQVNAVLEVRGKDTVQENLTAALDYALGVFNVSPVALNAEQPNERLILGIALLALEAPFTTVATVALKSSEVENDGMSVKETYADAPVEQFPIIAGILAPYRVSNRPSISFGASSR